MAARLQPGPRRRARTRAHGYVIRLVIGGLSLALAAAASLSTTTAATAMAQGAAYSARLYDGTFASLSDSGWVGGDATNSVGLPDGRDCWLFSDTITSSSANGLTVAHNSIVVTGRGHPQVVDAPLPQPSPDAFYWVGAARVHLGQIWEIAARIVQTGPGLWDFHFAGNWLAKINIANWRLASMTPLTGTTNAPVDWGVAMLDLGSYTYIYGSESDGLSSWMHIARVPHGRLDAPWSYYTGRRWTAHFYDSRRLLSGVAPAFSVVDLGSGRGIRVITQEPIMGRAIYSWHAATPVGPFTSQHTIYTTGSFGTRTYTYDTLAHPEQTADGAMLFSFNVNSFDALTPDDVALYRPRFFRVPLSRL